MDAAELLSGGESFVIDTSAWWRLSVDTSAWWRISVLPQEFLGPLRTATLDDRMLTTPVVRMEILYSARSSAEYAAYDAELSALRMLRNDRAAAVFHKDGHFDRLAEVLTFESVALPVD